MKTMRCRKPDRDAPNLRCGYPLPCPYHTVVLDLRPERETILRKYKQERFIGVRKYKCRSCSKVIVKTGISYYVGHDLTVIDYVVLADHTEACAKKEAR